jgi:hypothetical protein
MSLSEDEILHDFGWTDWSLFTRKTQAMINKAREMDGVVRAIETKRSGGWWPETKKHYVVVRPRDAGKIDHETTTSGEDQEESEPPKPRYSPKHDGWFDKRFYAVDDNGNPVSSDPEIYDSVTDLYEDVEGVHTELKRTRENIQDTVQTARQGIVDWAQKRRDALEAIAKKRSIQNQRQTRTVIELAALGIFGWLFFR